jgi:hypothetical protein
MQPVLAHLRRSERALVLSARELSEDVIVVASEWRNRVNVTPCGILPDVHRECLQPDRASRAAITPGSNATSATTDP